MNKLQFIIDKINIVLIKLGEIILGLLLKITPKFLQNFIHNALEWLERKKIAIKSQSSYIKKQVKESAKNSVEKVKSLDIQKKVDSTKDVIKKIFTRTFLASLFALILIKIKAFKIYLSSLSPNAILGVFFASVIGFFGVINLYFSGQGLYSKTVGRKVASVPDNMPGERPKYHKKERTQTFLNDLSLPVYIESRSTAYKQLIIDVKLQFTNRYTTNYVRKHSHELKDYINNHMEPFVSDFPLTPEGKRIIKGKIFMEVQNYLKSKKEIEGDIEKVFILSVLAN